MVSIKKKYMFTPLPKKMCNANVSCQCQGCRCNYTEILLYPAAVPGGVAIPSSATGAASLVLTNKKEFYVRLAVRNIQGITMSHIHLNNTKDSKTNGPILLWLENSTTPVFDGTLVSKMFTTADFAAPYTNMPLEKFKDLIVHKQLYFNVHTVANPNGELAGPIIPTLELGC